jgi:hypothetical protein
LITGKIADAAIEGKNIRGVIAAEAEEEGAVVVHEPVVAAEAEPLPEAVPEAPEASEEQIEEIEAEEASEGEGL